jgi:hypothetical protein
MERGSVIDAEQTKLEFSEGTVEVTLNGSQLYLNFSDWLRTAEWNRMNRKIKEGFWEITRPRPSLYIRRIW